MNIHGDCDKCTRKNMCNLLSEIKEIIDTYTSPFSYPSEISIHMTCNHSKVSESRISGYPAGTVLSKTLNCDECDFRYLCKIYKNNDYRILNKLNEKLNNLDNLVMTKLICYGYNKEK